MNLIALFAIVGVVAALCNGTVIGIAAICSLLVSALPVSREFI